jgi:hypothetical protein
VKEVGLAGGHESTNGFHQAQAGVPE